MSKDQDRLDAERYRFLRDGTTGMDGEPSCWLDTGYGEGFPRIEGEDLDKAVDTAIKNRRGQ